ncbi:unnamed protein product [Heterobilharzia americana]|nr:unnamed protein product [Heterobilharzia americana]
MRIILDVHSMVRCGPEPIITWEVMNFRKSAESYQKRLMEAGVDSHVLDEATAAFIVSVIENMGPPAVRLCHKQPGIYYHLRDLGDLFYKAKFIHMIRDGRAAVFSTVAAKQLGVLVNDNKDVSQNVHKSSNLDQDSDSSGKSNNNINVGHKNEIADTSRTKIDKAT